MKEYFLAIEELKNNFNDKNIMIIDKKKMKMVYKDTVKVEYITNKFDNMNKTYIIFTLTTEEILALDFDNIYFSKYYTNIEKKEYALIYEKYIIITENLTDEKIKNYINLQNIDMTSSQVEEILYN